MVEGLCSGWDWGWRVRTELQALDFAGEKLRRQVRVGLGLGDIAVTHQRAQRQDVAAAHH